MTLEVSSNSMVSWQTTDFCSEYKVDPKCGSPSFFFSFLFFENCTTNYGLFLNRRFRVNKRSKQNRADTEWSFKKMNYLLLEKPEKELHIRKWSKNSDSAHRLNVLSWEAEGLTTSKQNRMFKHCKQPTFKPTNKLIKYSIIVTPPTVFLGILFWLQLS